MQSGAPKALSVAIPDSVAAYEASDVVRGFKSREMPSLIVHQKAEPSPIGLLVAIG